MIDPRMLKPDAIAPTTDIVTPSPQYYGQGQVVGGQVQLGDVYGQLPSQSQEEYLYGNLASMAQSAMSMFKFPAQMQEAEMQRKTQQDNDKLFEYSAAQNELQQAQLNQQGTFKWNDEDYDISNPELFNSLELKMQEYFLSGMQTKRGISQAAEIKTRSLARRNQDVDGRIKELMVEWNEAYEKFSVDNLLIEPTAFYSALQSNPKLTELRNRIQSYRDTDSTTMESALATIFKTEYDAFKAQREYILQSGTEILVNTTGEMVEALPEILPLIHSPFGPAAVAEWLGPIENPEPLFAQIGLIKNPSDQWEIQSGSLLDKIGEQGTVRDVKELVSVVLKHSLQSNTAFANDLERESFANNVSSRYNQQLVRISSIYSKMRINRAQQERAAALGLGRNDYIRGTSTDNPSEFFTGVDEKQAAEITIVSLQNPENNRKGIDLRKFIERDAMDAVRHNLGTPGIPLSTREQNFARQYLGGVKDLVSTGMYEMQDGQMFLSERGVNEVQKRSNEIIRNVINDPAYLNLFITELDSLEWDKKYVPGTYKDIESLERALNADFIKLFREYFPSGNLSNEDVLKGIGAMDTLEGEPMPPGVAKLFDRPATNMFQGVIKNILAAHSKQRENEARDAAVIPDAWKAFQKDTTELLEDDSPETLAVIQIFEEDLSKATTDREKAIVFTEYANKPWMTSVMMANLLRKHQQIQQRMAVANYVIGRVGQGALAPDTPPQLTFQDFIKKLEIRNPAELWSNPKYLDASTKKFTKEGLKTFALWSAPFFIGPKVTDANRETVQKVMDEMVNSETTFARDGNTEMQGIPLLMMAEFITAIDSSTFPGIANAHFQSTNKVPVNLTMTDANGNQVDLDLSYDPNVFQQQGLFESVFGNPSQVTTKLQLHMARKIAQQIRGLPNIDRQAVLDETKKLSRNYALILSLGVRDVSTASSERFSSAGPVGIMRNQPGYPRNAVDFNDLVKQSLANKDYVSVVNALTSLGNFYLNPTEPDLVVTGDNRHLVTKDVALSMSGFLKNQGKQLWIPTPDSFASWYNKTAKEEDRIQEGDVLPLWGGPKSIAAILESMNEEYLENRSWFPFTPSFGSEEEKGTLEHDMLGMIFEAGYMTLDISGFGMQPLMNTALSIVASGRANQMLPSSRSGLRSRLESFYDLTSLIDGHTYANGTLPTVVTEYSGNQKTQTKRINLPPAYHHNGSPIPWGFGSPISVENSDGEKVPLFNNKSHEVASLFLLSKPNTSSDPVKFAKARISYLSNNITTPNQWETLNAAIKQQVVDLASQNLTNAQFFEQASALIDPAMPRGTFFPPDFTGLTNNKAGLLGRGFRNAWASGGYYIMEDARGTGYTTNNNGHIVVGLKGRPSTRIPLDPELMRLTDMSELGTLLIKEEKERQTTRRSPVPMEAVESGWYRISPMSSKTMLGPVPISGYMTYTRQYEGSRRAVYKDTNGLATIGVGHNLMATDSKKAIQEVFKGEISHDDLFSGRVSLTNEQVEALFKHDIERHLPVAYRLFGGKEKFESFPEWLQVGLLDGVFQGRFKSTHTTVKAIRKGDWEVAANNINDSKAYRTALAAAEKRKTEGKPPIKGGTLERYQRLEELLRRMAEMQRTQV